MKTDKPKLVTILALDDRDTFCRINGASIITITEKQYELLQQGVIDLNEVEPLSEIVLKDASKE